VPKEAIIAALVDGKLACDLDRNRLFRDPLKNTGDLWEALRQPRSRADVWEYIDVRVASIDVVLAAPAREAGEAAGLPTPASPAVEAAVSTEQTMFDLIFRVGLSAADVCCLKAANLEVRMPEGEEFAGPDEVEEYQLTFSSANSVRTVVLEKRMGRDLDLFRHIEAPNIPIFFDYTPLKILSAFNRAARRAELDPIAKHWALKRAGFRVMKFGRPDEVILEPAGSPPLVGQHTTRLLRIVDRIRAEISAMEPAEREKRWRGEAIKARAKELDRQLTGNDRVHIAAVLLSDKARRK
jgi:hypothetical protein